jgi:hypothetical protein
MRRALALLTTSTILYFLGGCGEPSYEKRLSRTIADIHYRKRLDSLLMPAPAKGKLEQLQIYVRPPKSLLGPAKEFTLTPALEPGKFDVADSFSESTKQSMHILARTKQARAAAGKKAEAIDPAVRGDFNVDVYTLLNGIYNVEIDSSKAKSEKKKQNAFKSVTFEGNGKVVRLYLYGSKTSPPEVALVFEYPKLEEKNLNLVDKIDLCLESFATGERARMSYSGALPDEETGEAAGGGGAVAF